MQIRIKNLEIDPAIFTYPFHCKCNGECCVYGVYTDMSEYEGIMEIKDKIIPLLDNTQPADIAQWFEKPSEDSDFPSGYAVGTEIFNDKCVFLCKDGLCTLQKLAIAEEKYPWIYKPLYCILFPLTIYDGKLTIDYEHIERLSHCNKLNPEQVSIYDYCRPELTHLFNEEEMAILDQHKEKYLKLKGK